MVAEAGERRPPAKGGATVAPPPPEQEQLPCPRCDSINTKFCYYNNYNFSQPRHFCKACRRYWTQGGALRDIPVGGGTRKHAKRTRCLAPPPAAATTTTAAAAVDPVSAFPGGGFGVVPSAAGSFTSLLGASPAGFLAVGGLGFGIGHGLDEFGFAGGYFSGGGGGVARGDGGGAPGGGMNAWLMGGGGDQGGGGFVAGDCFPAWPELAISTPGNGFK